MCRIEISSVKQRQKKKLMILSELSNLEYQYLKEMASGCFVLLLNVEDEKLNDTLTKLSKARIKYKIVSD